MIPKILKITIAAVLLGAAVGCVATSGEMPCAEHEYCIECGRCKFCAEPDEDEVEFSIIYTIKEF